MQLLRKIRNHLRKKVSVLVLIVKGLGRLAIKGRFAWLIYIVEHRLQYGLNALYSGVSMNRCGQANLYNFRRNIHRIEKGLLYKQLKDVFAEAYILETVNYLSQIKSVGVADKNTIAWGEAVLNQYFKTCLHTKKVAEAYRLYQSLEPQNSQPTWHPYPEKCRPELSVEYGALYQLALRRRSVRYYLNTTVEFNVVEKAMKVAALSPSACNRQAFKFLFYNDKRIVKAISEIQEGIAGYEIPSVVVVIGSYRGYFDERDLNVPIIDSSLAVMSFLFALETLGLSSVCMNWPSLPDWDKRVRQLIHLEEDEFVIMLIGIGYPDPEGKIPYSAKREVSELILCNERIRNQGTMIVHD